MNLKLTMYLIALGFYLAGGFFIWYQGARIDSLKEKLELSETNLSKCREGQRLSQEIYDATQAKLDGLNKQLNDPKWLRQQAKCIPTSQCNEQGSGGKLSGRDGLTVGYLRDFAGRCESVRIRLLGAQDYIREMAK